MVYDHWDDITEFGSNAAGWVGDRFEDAGDVIDSATDWAGDRLSDAGAPRPRRPDDRVTEQDFGYAHLVEDVVLLEEVSRDGFHRFALTRDSGLLDAAVAAAVHPDAGAPSASRSWLSTSAATASWTPTSCGCSQTSSRPGPPSVLVSPTSCVPKPTTWPRALPPASPRSHGGCEREGRASSRVTRVTRNLHLGVAKFIGPPPWRGALER